MIPLHTWATDHVIVFLSEKNLSHQSFEAVTVEVKK
jgi:hypothetical protein